MTETTETRTSGSLSTVIQEARGHLVRLGYSREAQRHFNCTWRRLAQFAAERGVAALSVDLTEAFLLHSGGVMVASHEDRYIHLNPLRAGLVSDVTALDGYPWAGHSRLLGYIDDGWQDVDYVQGQFGRRVGSSRGAYRSFVAAGVAQGRRPELTGGGLRRSAGSWQAVAALRRGRECWAFDERILGSSEFVQRAHRHHLAGAQSLDGLRTASAGVEEITAGVAGLMGLSVPELCSGAKRRAVVEGRAVTSLVAVRAGARTMRIADTLRVSPRAVTRLLPLGARLMVDRHLDLAALLAPARACHADSRAVDKRVHPRAIAANCRDCLYVPHLPFLSRGPLQPATARDVHAVG